MQHRGEIGSIATHVYQLCIQCQKDRNGATCPNLYADVNGVIQKLRSQDSRLEDGKEKVRLHLLTLDTDAAKDVFGGMHSIEKGSEPLAKIVQESHIQLYLVMPFMPHFCQHFCCIRRVHDQYAVVTAPFRPCLFSNKL